MSTDAAPPDPATAAALQRLHEALEQPPRGSGATVAVGNWRWLVRQRIGALRDALATGGQAGGTTWRAATTGDALRERTRLMTELGRWLPEVLEATDLDATRAELGRLVTEVRHHVHHVHAPPARPEEPSGRRVDGTPSPARRR